MNRFITTAMMIILLLPASFSAQARFTQSDTWAGNQNNPVTLHKYLYGNGNPANNIDPSGHYSLTEIGAANSIASELIFLQTDISFNILDVAIEPRNAANNLIGGAAIGLGVAGLGVAGFKVLKILSKKFRQACPGSNCIPVSNVRMDHILTGEVKGPRASGWHHRPSGIPGTHTVLYTGPKDKNGVYEAVVAIKNDRSPLGNQWKKKGSQNDINNKHTFFPDNWSPVRIETEIRSAYTNFLSNGAQTQGGWWIGKSPSGVTINGKINSNGLVETAFPLFGK